MWIFLNDAMLSVVVPSKRDLPKHLLNADVLSVRARRKGDIERVFPGAKVIRLEGRDYDFRAYLDREDVADAMQRSVREITYTNFKNSVRDDARHDAYMDVWSAMLRLQNGTYHKRIADRNRRMRQAGRDLFGHWKGDDPYADDSRWNFAERGR